MTEAALHRAVARYLKLALPSHWLCTTFPAGGGGKVRGAQLKAMGLASGMPDLMILGDGEEPMWIELKSRKGVLSTEQKLRHIQLRDLGCKVAICRSIEDVQETLIGWGIAPKARAA